MLVQQYAQNQRERVPAQQLVRGVVLGDPEGRHGVILPHGRRSAAARGVVRYGDASVVSRLLSALDEPAPQIAVVTP